MKTVSNPILSVSLSLCFWFINLLFILKYSLRFSSLLTILSISFFSLYTIAAIQLYKKRLGQQRINKSKHFKYFYIGLVVIMAIFFIWINVKTDAYKLHVDRWSALAGGIQAVLKGQYTYTVADHLGGRTSNLPGLFIIGLPFFLMKDVGLLQVFTFLLISYLIYDYFDQNYEKLFALLLILSSPAYYWEIFVKSDLMSNLILVMTFLIYWQKKLPKKSFDKPFSLGIITGILLFTRLIVLIPFEIFLFQEFIKTSTKNKRKFIVALMLTIIFIWLPILYTIESFKTFIHYNPFSLQSSQIPFIWLVFFLLVPLFVASRIGHDLDKKILFSGIFLLLPVLYNFIDLITKIGFERSFIGSVFDISYFNMALAFVILSIPKVINKYGNKKI